MAEIFIKLFLAMREDDLIQQIQSDVDADDKKIELDDNIDQTVDVYVKDILTNCMMQKQSWVYITGIIHFLLNGL